MQLIMKTYFNVQKLRHTIIGVPHRNISFHMIKGTKFDNNKTYKCKITHMYIMICTTFEYLMKNILY